MNTPRVEDWNDDLPNEAEMTDEDLLADALARAEEWVDFINDQEEC